MPRTNSRYWPSARHFTEAIQCPRICFSNPLLRETEPAVDRLGMPLVTSGQFAYVYKLKAGSAACDFAVRCFRGYLGDRDQRYKAIQQHIQTHPLPFLSGFNYEPEGILVGGFKFPVLFMKWIVGPTLDLYLDDMIGRRDVLQHLAEEWIKLVGTLHEAGIAHGDLQHGNIIVEHGRLRLVDHDGMFVPEMTGWSSSELGHQHYQHPRRDAQFFDSALDNFSALVIYLSLISLAEQPSLRAEFQDENLIFRKSDFIDPASSSLFAKIKRLSAEHERLADILQEAAIGPPDAVPYLLELVDVKSSLPSWMKAPLDLEAKTRTREVIPTEPTAHRNDGRWIPWQPKPVASSVPTTHQSSTVQTIFGGPAVLTPSAALANIRDPSDVVRNTLTFGKELFSKNFLWWYWAIYLCLSFLGLDFLYAIFIAMSCMAVICLTYGFIRARELAHAASQTNLSLGNPLASNSLSTTPLASSVSWRRPHLQPASITATGPIIGNLALSIYHLQDCAWAEQISNRNRISFPSTLAALSAGYKPCRVCSPVK